MPVLGSLLFFTFFTSFLLLSCDDLDSSKDSEPSNKVSEAVIKAYPEPLQDFMRAILDNSAKSLDIVYISKNGGSDPIKDGSTWERAYAEADLKTTIDAAGDAASAAKRYLVLLAPDTYTITSTLNMRNNVTIAGGIAQDGSPSTTQTILDGGGNTQIFSNSGLDKSATLYGVTITKGRKDGANSAGSSGGRGGGMYNTNSSPSLLQITFSSNKADDSGGGMYNTNSSPSLTQVIFFENEVGRPTTGHGGGMYNTNSSPILTQVTFSGNTARTGGSIRVAHGGGMYNANSSPILTQVTFWGNKAGRDGGAMYNDNDGTGPKIVNSIFWGNTAVTGNAKSQIYMLNGSGGAEHLSIHNSVLEDGVAGFGYRNAPPVGGDAPNTNIAFSGIIIDDPQLTDDTLDLYPGASATIPTIQMGSSAIDKGLHVQRDGSTFYYSKDASSWYTDFDSSGLIMDANLPNGATDLTATDITNHPTTGRPDIGVFESR